MSLNFYPVLEKPDLVSASALSAIKAWKGQTHVSDMRVAEIDPTLCGGEDFCAQYGIERSAGANCLIVEARRGEEKSYHACLAPVDAKMDLGGKLRKHLGARQVSLAPLDFVLEKTKMEFGSITPLGLPEGWQIFIDASLADIPRLVIGGGLCKSKLQLPLKALLQIPGAFLIQGLVKSP